MEYYGKERKVYRGIWAAAIAMFAFPAAIYGLLYWAISVKTSYTPQEITYMCLGFAGLVGFLYCFTLILTGTISDLFENLVKRIRETFEFYGPFSKDGMSYYWYSFFHDGGPVLWGFFIFMFGYAGVSAFGFISYFLNLYS